MNLTRARVVPSVLVALAACGGKPIEVAPESVAVSVGKGLEPTFDVQLTERLKERLTEAGFVVVPAGTPAALQVSFEGELARQRDGLAPASALVEATLSVVATDASQEKNTAALRFAREVVRPLDAAELERKSAVEKLADETIAWLVLRPAMIARVDWLSQRRGSSGLLRTRPLAEARRDHMRDWESARVAEVERAALLDKDAGATCLGPVHGSWTVAGVAPDGQSLFVVDRTARASFGLSPDPTPDWETPSVSLLQVATSGDGPPKVVWRSREIHEVYVSSDGARLLVLAATTGESRGLVPLDAASGAPAGPPILLRDDVRFQGAIVARGGNVVTLEDRDFHVYAPDRKPLPEVAMVWAVGDGLVGQDEQGLLVRMDAAGKELGTVAFDVPVAGVIGASDGSVYVLQRHEDACTVTSLAKDTLAIAWTRDLDVCVANLTMLPDGRLAGSAEGSIGIDTPGDTEVVVVEPTSGRVTVLTRDPHDVVGLRAGGARVAYGRDLGAKEPSPLFQWRRMQVCWLDVPPRTGPVPPPPAPRVDPPEGVAPEEP